MTIEVIATTLIAVSRFVILSLQSTHNQGVSIANIGKRLTTRNPDARKVTARPNTQMATGQFIEAGRTTAARIRVKQGSNKDARAVLAI